MTEAMGGFWSATTEDVKYVPLDEVLSEKFLADVQGDFETHELVLDD